MTEAVNDGVDTYLAVGGETSFTYTFQVNTVISPALHPITVETRLGLVLTTLVEGVDFTVTGAGNPLGGTTVLDTGVFPAGAIAGVTWTLKRDNPVERVTDFQTAGDFFALEVNDQLDYITQILQEQNRDADSNFANSIRLATSSLFALGTMLDPIAGTFLRATAGGNFDWASLIPAGTATSVDETDTNATKDKLLSNLLANLWETLRTTQTTKGDLLSFSTIHARLGIGIAGQRLVPDTAEAIGLKWANQLAGDGKSSAYTVIATDQNKIIGLSGASFTISLTSAATLGAGFVVWFHHDGTTGTQVYTLDPAGTETIDEALTDNLHTASETVGISSDGANWHVVSRNVPTRQHVIQVLNVQDGEVATGTTAMVNDDTIPQNTEGDEYMTLSITPTSSTHKLIIDVVCHVSNSNAGTNRLQAALFQDTTVDALASGAVVRTGNAQLEQITFRHFMTAGTVSATTFKVRAGGNAGATTTFNGESGARIHGGVMASSITITEYEAS